MVNNLEKWNALAKPPASALKEIEFGALKGKSDINPQWRLKAFSEVYGEAGKDWGLTIDKVWSEPGANGEVMVFAIVSITVAGGVPVQGIGGNKILQLGKGVLHNNDEGYKMAVTDAIGVAMKSFGVAADIYLGNFDGSKYKEARPAEPITESDVNACATVGALAALYNRMTEQERTGLKAALSARRAQIQGGAGASN